MSKKYTMHVISGTHWDREWRHTSEQSKLRLSDLMDATIALLEQNKDYKCFCVDGGMVVMEDYLAVRPENRERIIKLVKEKRMQLVSWYTLPETFTVAPEAIVRNLLVGSKMAGEFGGAMETGYTATSYGLTSQLPQIYQGFGIKTAMFYRGTNKHALPQSFIWEGIDGSQLYSFKTFDEVTRTNWFFYVHYPLVLNKKPKDLAYFYDRGQVPVHMCDEELYEKAFVVLNEKIEFKRDTAALKTALEYITKQATPYAIGNHLLALNMEDNDQPFALLPEMIKELNEISPDIEIKQNSLDEYVKKIMEDTKNNKMHIHKGEIRFPAVEEGFNGLLGATHSSRIKLKLQNEKAETNLLCLAEPMASMAALCGYEYPKFSFDAAWSALLKNHAHDSICGAAVDQAHEDNLYGYSLASTVAQEITSRSMISLFKKIDTSRKFSAADHVITLFNTLNMPRNEVISLVVDFPKHNRDVGAGLGFGDTGATGEYFDIADLNGNVIDYQLLSVEEIKIGVERELDSKAVKLSAIRERLLFKAEVPAIGYSTYSVRLREPNYIAKPEPGPDRELIAREDGTLENEHICVVINSNGTFSILHKETGRVMDNLHYFTDSGEIGVGHLSIKPQRNHVYTSLGSAANITMIETNLMRGIYRIDIMLAVPAAATLDGKDRLREMVELPVTYWLTLEKGGKYLKIKTHLNNKARDHKLCVNFPSGIRTDYAISETSFAVEKRCIRWADTGDNFESFYPFQPMQNFVDVNDGKD
ncbi:MAG: glycoside hydrolase family 38 C-terminal domain-containing protein, partial [Clostridiales bacterium]|nr:glycoside hydrolase family 38 C-terminal domain-containing protein [Clostridiales bacterium]